MNELCPCEDLKVIKKRVDVCEERLNRSDITFAVINTKLTAIIWMLGVVGTALVGVLIKLIFKM